MKLYRETENKTFDLLLIDENNEGKWLAPIEITQDQIFDILIEEYDGNGTWMKLTQEAAKAILSRLKGE